MQIKVSKLFVLTWTHDLNELNFQLQKESIEVDDIISIKEIPEGFVIFYKEVII